MDNQDYNNNNNYNGNNPGYNDTNNNYNSNYNNPNPNYPYPQNNWCQNPNPFSQENMFFNKTEFREYLVSMEKGQRTAFVNSLHPEFVKSSRMPSLKSKFALVVFTLVSLFTFISIDRLYAGKIFSGIIKLILPIIGFIVYGIILLVAAKGNGSLNYFGVLGPFIGAIFIIFIIGWLIWIWTDFILAVLGKRKDKNGRRIDVS